MNLIQRTFSVRGKTTRLQELTDLKAVRQPAPAAPGGKRSKADRSRLSSQQIESVLAAVLPQLRSFEAAGWSFVTGQPSTSPDNPPAARVYVKSGDRLALGTNRLSIQLQPNLSEARARDWLSQNGLEVVEQLKFAPNLFTVRIPADRDPIDAAEDLTKSFPVVIFAEPQLIEAVGGR